LGMVTCPLLVTDVASIIAAPVLLGNTILQKSCCQYRIYAF
jgi:hypothetical protein